MPRQLGAGEACWREGWREVSGRRGIWMGVSDSQDIGSNPSPPSGCLGGAEPMPGGERLWRCPEHSPAGWTQGWPAGWTVGGLLGSDLPASCPFIILCAPDWAPFPQCCSPNTEQGPPCSWNYTRAAWGGATPQPEITTDPDPGSLQMDLFSLLARLTFGISGCWPHARLLWPSACQLL